MNSATVLARPVRDADKAPTGQPRRGALPEMAALGRHGAGGNDLVVPRRELYRRLAGAQRVTQLSAAAGSGKTVLLRSWIDDAGLADRTAWVSVEQDEPDLQRFWLSLLDALRATTVGEAFAPELTAAPDVDGWAIVERLIGDLDSLAEPIWLVIDDVDELRSDQAMRQIELLVSYAPATLRCVFSGRRDARVGLHRLRLDGDLTEIRTDDLRFTRDDARALFEGTGVRLSDVALEQLMERTEGWAAGLRLAALSMADHQDPDRFAREFSGSERTVAGYLVAEVLGRQPAEVRELLLRTSLLDRVSGPLADHLTSGSGSELILHELEDANAFVTSLDAGRSWFRYHRLFAEFLRLELRRAYPATVGSLHRAAADWLGREGYTVEAVRHAQRAHDWPQAARQLLDNRIGLVLDGRLATVRELADAFPARVAAADPELAVTLAGVRLREGSFEEADACIAVAERHANEVPDDRKRPFGLHLASVRLGLARQRGDVSGAVEAMTSLESALATEPPHVASRADEIRALALLSLGTAELWSLRLTDARRHLEDGLGLARRIGRPYLEIGCLAHLGVTAPLSGLPASVALDLAEQAVAIAEEHGLATNPVVALAFANGAGSLALLGRFDESERWLDRAELAFRREGDPGTELVLHRARGLLYCGRGRLPDALAAFRRAETAQARLVGEHALAVDLRARVILTQVWLGEIAGAGAALDSIGEQDRDRAEVRIPAAAIHIAEGSLDRAVEVLAPVIERSVESLTPTWAAVEALLLDAAAHEQIGNTRAAEESLERALDLAEPEGLILPFTIEAVEGVLERSLGHRTSHAKFLREILDVRAGESATPRREPGPLADELSAAELRVIRFLPSNLKAPEIAAELFVSTNTIRTHLRHIYGKLGAHGRAEAVARARELGLLAPRHRRR